MGALLTNVSVGHRVRVKSKGSEEFKDSRGFVRSIHHTEAWQEAPKQKLIKAGHWAPIVGDRFLSQSETSLVLSQTLIT